jgi:hypothetical protein
MLYLALDFLVPSAFVLGALASVCLVAFFVARPKRTATLGMLLVIVTAVGAANAARAPENTGIVPLRLLGVKSPVVRGDQARLAAAVFPDRPRCTISVDSRDGPVHAKGLSPTRPAVGGRLAWKWTVGAHATLGWSSIRVDCGTLGSLRARFRVVR